MTTGEAAAFEKGKSLAPFDELGILIDMLRNDQPSDRQAQREARIVLHGLLTKAANNLEILKIRLDESSASLNVAIRELGKYSTDAGYWKGRAEGLELLYKEAQQKLDFRSQPKTRKAPT